MKYAIFGDIHSNLEALNAVLEDSKEQGVSHFTCVGDIVGYNANPKECLKIIRELNCKAVKGNHDHFCSGNDCLDAFQPLAASVVRWTRNQLSEEECTYLRGLRLVAPVASFTIVHSTLDTPLRWGYVFDKFEAEASFSYQSTSTCFYGHTHVPLVFVKGDGVECLHVKKIDVEMGKKYFVNVGSVGQPRDGDPRASYAIYDLKEKTIEMRRVAYDIEITQQKILAAGLPTRIAERLAQGK